MGREVYIVGNWKMYKTAREATDYIEKLVPKIEGCKQNVYLAVPFTSIAPASAFVKDTNLVIGAQNMNDAREGAFTGEIAGLMLKEAGASFVILGHSERRHLFGETNAFIQRKVLSAFQDDIQPILCVGETSQERKDAKTEEVLQEQISTALSDVPEEGIERLILAYEPVWAIGTGLMATAEMAEEAHAFCRSVLSEMFGKRKANRVPILYGGSVKPGSVEPIILQKDIDGVLVGGASLDPDTFSLIVQECVKKGKE